VFRPSDQVYVVNIDTVGNDGEVDSELAWTRSGRDVAFTPIQGGPATRVRDVTELLQTGFRLFDGKSFQSSVVEHFGPLTLYRLSVCTKVWDLLPRWDFREPVADVGCDLATKRQQEIEHQARMVVTGISPVTVDDQVTAAGLSDATRALLRVCKDAPVSEARAQVHTAFGVWRSHQMADATLAVKDRVQRLKYRAIMTAGYPWWWWVLYSCFVAVALCTHCFGLVYHYYPTLWISPDPFLQIFFVAYVLCCRYVLGRIAPVPPIASHPK